MKIAFLILAHQDLAQLDRLIRALDYPQFDIFVHLDARADAASFSVEGLRYSRLTILPQRRSIYWGDISIVDATLDLYRAALNAGAYGRFVMLSGEDYPIRSNGDIHRQLCATDTEYILGSPISKQDVTRVRDYWFWKMPNKLLFRLTRKLLRWVNIRKKLYVDVNGSRWPIYLSSQWHALTRECVECILEVIRQEPSLLRYFKYSYAPDEMLIPTIIYNTEKFSKKTVTVGPEKLLHFDDRPVLHYLQYLPGNGSTVERFDETAYDAMVSSDKLFARKVVSNKSEKLIELLDANRT